MSKPDSEDAKERRDEIRELLERCRSMEKELGQIKEKVAKLQKSVEERMGRKNSGGSSLHRNSAELKASRTRFHWPVSSGRFPAPAELR